MPRNMNVGLGVSVIVRRGRDLLYGLRKSELYKDHWAFPGGWVEESESLAEAAVRELYEETGIRVSPADTELIGTVQHHLDVPTACWNITAVHLITVSATVEAVVLEPEKCAEWRWAWMELPGPGPTMPSTLDAWRVFDRRRLEVPTLEESMYQSVVRALDATGGNVSAAGRIIEMPKASLYRYMNTHRIDPMKYRNLRKWSGPSLTKDGDAK